MTLFKLNSFESSPNKFHSMPISSSLLNDNDIQITVNSNAIIVTNYMENINPQYLICFCLLWGNDLQIMASNLSKLRR